MNENAKPPEKGGPSLSEQLERRWHDAVIAVLVLLCPALIGMGFFAFSDTRKGIGMAMLTAAASFSAGAFFGFLFGIPRVLASPQGEATESRDDGRNRIAPNTNLEQISDWLTKILVGVGLVELGNIAGGVGHLAEGLAPSLGGDEVGYPVAVTLMVSFTVTGFVGSYLFARLRLEGAFSLSGLIELVERKAEQVEEAKEEVGEKVQEVREAAEASARVRLAVESQLQDGEVAQDELVEAMREAPNTDKINAFYAAREVRRTNWRGGDKSLVARTIPIFEALVGCDEKNVFHRNHGELAYALKDQQTPDIEAALKEIEIAIAMRGHGREEQTRYWPYELTRAWCKIKLDHSFRSETRSSDDLVAAVSSDLEVPMRTGTGFKAVKEDHDIARWIELNLGNPQVDALKSRLAI